MLPAHVPYDVCYYIQRLSLFISARGQVLHHPPSDPDSDDKLPQGHERVYDLTARLELMISAICLVEEANRTDVRS